ncbi:MAG: hypothetical protein KDC66_23055 [Phaeodactylibacter sp.]|nr:hypothetical protein [Phaeodactylibacter sp.]
MSVIEIRPRFQQQLAMSPSEVIERLRAALQQPGIDIIGAFMEHHVVLRFPPEKQHYWSPQLALELEEMEGGALLRGLFGPRPSVWLMFMFMYSILGLLSLFVAIMGFSQVSLGLSAPILWTLPIAAVLALFLYFSAKTGERLGRDEMLQLQNFLGEALVLPVEVVKQAEGHA